jgi:hypothetical protein
MMKWKCSGPEAVGVGSAFCRIAERKKWEFAVEREDYVI